MASRGLLSALTPVYIGRSVSRLIPFANGAWPPDVCAGTAKAIRFKINGQETWMGLRSYAALEYRRIVELTMRMKLVGSTLGIWLTFWALLALATRWFDWRGPTSLFVAIIGGGYALYTARVCTRDADPLRLFKRLGAVATVLSAVIGGIGAEGAAFMGSFGGRVLGISIEGAFVGAIGGMIAGFAIAVVGQAIVDSAAHAKSASAGRNPKGIVNLDQAERKSILNSLDCLSQHLGGADGKLPSEIPNPDEVRMRVQSKTVQPADLKLIVNSLGLYRWLLKQEMARFPGMTGEQRLRVEGAEMEHSFVVDLCRRLCDEGAEHGMVIPDLSSKVGFF